MGQQLEEGQEECHQAVYSKRPDVLVPEELVEVDQKELDEVVQKVLVEVVQKELVDVDQKELVEVVPAEKDHHILLVIEEFVDVVSSKGSDRPHLRIHWLGFQVVGKVQEDLQHSHRLAVHSPSGCRTVHPTHSSFHHQRLHTSSLWWVLVIGLMLFTMELGIDVDDIEGSNDPAPAALARSPWVFPVVAA